MDYYLDKKELCESQPDCLLCTDVNCSWTGSIFRPCKEDISDMEEVPEAIIIQKKDCPLTSLENATASLPDHSPQAHWFTFGNTALVVVALFLLVFVVLVALYMRLKRFKKRNTQILLGLDVFGSSMISNDV